MNESKLSTNGVVTAKAVGAGVPSTGLRSTSGSEERGANLLTGPPQTVIPDSSDLIAVAERQTGGIDWLEFSCYGEFGGKWEELRTVLDEAKKIATKAADGRCLTQLPGSDHVVSVKPGGKNRGYGYCRWSFDDAGIEYGIVDRKDSGGDAVSGKGGHPVLYVKVSGLTCLIIGWREAVRRVREVMGFLGFSCVNECISRLDVCADVLGQSVRSYMRDFIEGRLVRRSDCWAMWGRGQYDGIETIRFGGDEGIKCRIYDKLEETKRDETKRSLMVSRRWGGVTPEQAIRVEYELGREELKSRGITNLKTMEAGMKALVDYLTHEWLRFTTEVPDRENGNQARAVASAEWEEVKRCFNEVVTGEPDYVPEPEHSKGVDMKQLTKQALGCIARIFAAADKLPTTKDQVWTEVGTFSVQHWRDLAFRTARARLQIENSQPDQGNRVKRAWCRQREEMPEGVEPLLELLAMEGAA